MDQIFSADNTGIDFDAYEDIPVEVCSTLFLLATSFRQVTLVRRIRMLRHFDLAVTALAHAAWWQGQYASAV